MMFQKGQKQPAIKMNCYPYLDTLKNAKINNSKLKVKVVQV